MLSTAASAAPKPYVLDKSHASIALAIPHVGLTNIQGLFREFEADILYDPADIAASSIVVRIHAAGIYTNWPRRDDHIRSGDFLDVDAHPIIEFRSTGVEPTGGNTARITGDLTIRGMTNEESFDVVLVGARSIRGRDVTGFHARGSIDPNDYGISIFLPPGPASEVGVSVAFEISPR